MKLTNQYIDFSDTEKAFAHLSDSELKKAKWLFTMMSKSWLVNNTSELGLWAVKNKLPFAKTIVKKTIFDQFVGGTTLLSSQQSIDRLWAFNARSVLDYGAEAKSKETDFNQTMNENMRAIDFAARTESISVVISKVSGLARFGLLERIQKAETLSKSELLEYRNVLKRLDAVCHHAAEKNVLIYIDAEESWIQDTIDHLTWIMMKRYNRERVVVYNTFQMYRHDRLKFLFESFDRALKEGFMLGAKLVRGAYMVKERKRAEDMGYPSPINPDKSTTDDHYNTAVRFCVSNYQNMSSCNASHNSESALLQVELMEKRGLDRNHPNLSFCQLYGMSDNLTFNLASGGYNVAKYLVYGQVEDVVPYLIRRAQENSAVTGDVGRELGFIQQEIKRRGI